MASHQGSHHTNGAALRAWLETATEGLSPELASRAQDEIRQHFDLAREDALAGGAKPVDAHRWALESLGDPREVNRVYREVPLGALFEGVPRPQENDPARTEGDFIGSEAMKKMNQPRLVWKTPKGDAQSFELASPEVIIGRRQDSDVVVSHQNASRIHAKVVEVEGGYELVDLDSHFGTFVNGKRIERHRLHIGDTIRIGRDAAELSYV